MTPHFRCADGFFGAKRLRRLARHCALQPTPGFEADFQSSVGEIHDLDPLATAILAEPAFAEDRVVLIENTAELQCSAQTRSRC